MKPARWTAYDCVHPVQVYLDLKDHPERASEAADKLRTQHFGHRARL